MCGRQFIHRIRERSGRVCFSYQFWRGRIKAISAGRGFVVLICLFSVCCLTVVYAQGSEQARDSAQNDKRGEVILAEQIIIPTVDDIRTNGYPKNENGETYGPGVWESMEQPDLLLVYNDLGKKGYVRQADFDDGVMTLEEAINHKPRQRTINMYSHDGVTIIGTFTIGN